VVQRNELTRALTWQITAPTLLEASTSAPARTSMSAVVSLQLLAVTWRGVQPFCNHKSTESVSAVIHKLMRCTAVRMQEVQITLSVLLMAFTFAPTQSFIST
jgi:hypothetical protein